MLVLTGFYLVVAGWMSRVSYRRGARSAGRRIGRRLEEYQNRRIERWAPTALTDAGEPGTSLRVLSDYENAVFAEARHSFEAAHSLDDEHQHVVVAHQLHGAVRRLRAEILARLEVDETL